MRLLVFHFAPIPLKKARLLLLSGLSKATNLEKGQFCIQTRKKLTLSVWKSLYPDCALVIQGLLTLSY